MRFLALLVCFTLSLVLAGCGQATHPAIATTDISKNRTDAPVAEAIRIHSRIAEDARINGDRATEKAAYEEILAVAPGNLGAILGLANLAGKSGAAEREIEFLTRAITITDKAETRLALAEAYKKLGHYRKARHHFAIGLALKPDNPAHRADYALVLVKLDEKDRAIHEIDRALDHNGAGLRERRLQAQIYKLAGYREGALIAFAASGLGEFAKPAETRVMDEDLGAKPGKQVQQKENSKPSAKNRKNIATTVRIQLGAFRNPENAQRAPENLARILRKGITLAAYVPGSPDGTPIFRIRSAPLPDKEAAKSLCRELRAKGQACLPIIHNERKWRNIA